VLPLQKHCTLLAHEEATLPLSLSHLPWLLPLQLPSPAPLPLPTLWLLPLPLPIAVVVGHCHCSHHQPSPPPSLLCCRQPLPSLSPLPSAIAVSITNGHHSCHLHWPLPLPLPSTISESCCLGASRIVFNQWKQRMLTVFYFVRTVGGALIKAR
jgi:hypothetical protein